MHIFVKDEPEPKVDSEKLERRAGFEPAHTGFADLRVNRFATGALENDCPGPLPEFQYGVGYFFPLSLKFSAK